MGIFSAIGKGILSETGKVGLGLAEGTGELGMWAAGGAGKALMGQFDRHAGHVIGAAATGAALGGILADQDGQVNPSYGAFKGAAVGLGLSMIPMGSVAVSGLGVAGLGAGMMGVNALGAIGKGMIKPKTIGDKATDFIKEHPELKGAELKAGLKKAGLEVGSKETVKIGLDNLGDFKLNKKIAIPAILGISAIEGISGGVKAFEKSRMGTNDGVSRTATPMLPTPDQTAISQPGNPTYDSHRYYANNAGATGDLVFAMHRNR